MRTEVLFLRAMLCLALFVLTSKIQAQSQTFTSSGTFTVPEGVYSVSVQCWGGGGGGGERSSTGGPFAGAGGGGGGYAGGVLDVSPGDVLTVTVGSGGIGALISNTNGSSGGSTIVSHSSGAITATGGGFGINQVGGPGIGGAGGSGSFTGTVAAQVVFNGGNGSNGSADDGGGGGGGAGDSEAGETGSVTSGGAGGISNGGAGGNGSTNNSGGGDGDNYGGGGGGASDNALSFGGSGADGVAVLSWSTFFVSSSSTNAYSSDDTYTVPAGVFSVDIQVWGAGGGGSDRWGGGSPDGGGGGGGGGFAGGTIDVDPGDNITINIGTGGGGGSGSGNDGENGEDSVVSHPASGAGITAFGGNGGESANGGGNGGNGGSGGSFTGTVADQVTYSGGDGGDGDSSEGGAGGGGAGSTGNGGNGENAATGTPVGGAGGNTGGGNGGNGGNDGAGGSGSAFGGGGGAAGDDDGAGTIGGDGANGGAIITFLCASLSLTSGGGTNNQIIDYSPFTDITYAVSGSATGVLVTGLPAGLSTNFSGGVLTISGTPEEEGTFNYTVTTTGSACTEVSLSGSIDIQVSLPVELTRFAAQPKEDMVELSWNTASELNNDYFQVEHSIDGIRFEAIGKVDGNGTTTISIDYQFLHRQPITGNNYYRLKQIDYDGAFEYSNVVVVQLSSRQPGDVRISPNPTVGTAFIRIPGRPEKVKFQLFNLAGQLIDLQPAPGDERWELDLSSLAKGVYLLRIEFDRQVISKQIVRQ